MRGYSSDVFGWVFGESRSCRRLSAKRGKGYRKRHGLKEITRCLQGRPADLWNNAACVIVVPGLKKAAFVIGGEYGKGLMSCRQDGRWSAPVFMMIGKGSWGLQIGAQSIDLVLLVMNTGGMEKLLKNKVSLGAEHPCREARSAETPAGATDAVMKANSLVIRTQGLFAGINLLGGVIHQTTRTTCPLRKDVSASDVA